MTVGVRGPGRGRGERIRALVVGGLSRLSQPH